MDITAFKGLNNVTDPLRVGVEWLAVANNVNITDTGAIEKRSGYSRVSTGSYTGAYTTKDFSRMYLVDGGSLKTFEGAVLKTGLSSATMYWAEVNEQVFYNNGTDRGIILPDNTVIEWEWTSPDNPSLLAVAGALEPGTYQVRCAYQLPDGRATGTTEASRITLGDGCGLQITGISQYPGAKTMVYIAPANSDVFQLATITTSSSFVWNSKAEDLGREDNAPVMNALPRGADVIQEWSGRIYAAQYFAGDNITAVWGSLPLGFHLFDLVGGFFLVPGRVHMLAATKSALVVGTDAKIFAYDGKTLDELAPYGVVPGQHWSTDKDRILFWSVRGVCAALPFSNLTERQVSVAPGISANGTIVQSDGQKRYVVVLKQGGSAFNQST